MNTCYMLIMKRLSDDYPELTVLFLSFIVLTVILYLPVYSYIVLSPVPLPCLRYSLNNFLIIIFGFVGLLKKIYYKHS